MFWTALHIIEITLWVILAASVAYVVFFAIIALFYEKDDFASTHANTGWALALVLTEVAPERQNEILKLGFDYGYDRVIIGYHWSSDVEAGRLLGCAVVARLNANDSFGKLIKKARAEYQKASKK
jgi:membrane-associated phospholipid phosphatase